jgi:signal peptidase II
LKKSVIIVVSVVFLVLFLDQLIKIYVKTHFCLGESVSIFGNWSYLSFTENNGMAFGMEFAGRWGKIILSIFRVIACGAIIYYIYTLIKKKASTFMLVTIALVFAGAAGNIVDSLFYGMIFSQSTPWEVATLFPSGGGYSSFLHGRVVDMFYFPLFDINFPKWLPLLGGNHFTFFEPVFNIADASITVAMFILIIFQKKLFKKDTEAKTEEIIKDNKNTESKPE